MAAANGVLTSPTLLRELRDPARREAAWRIFFKRYGPLIADWCRRWGLNHDDAEEVSAAVLSKLVTAMRDFIYDPAHRFRGWLKTVVNNEVRTFWRKCARRPGDQGSGDPDVHRQLEEVETPTHVDELVERLDDNFGRDLRRGQEVIERVRARIKPKTWQAYWLTVIEGEAAGDVAHQLKKSVAAVYADKWRVDRMLREEGAKQ